MTRDPGEPTPTHALLAQRILAIRLERGWTSGRLAIEARLDAAHLRSIERAEVDPRLSTLERLADALGVELVALIAGESPAPPPSDGFASLGLRLRRMREARSMSRAELAALAGISPQHLQRIESAKQSPTLRVLQGLAEALGVAPAELL